MLVSSKLRYLSDAWAKRRYVDMGLPNDLELEEEPVEVGQRNFTHKGLHNHMIRY
jgi:hypothetical protein